MHLEQEASDGREGAPADVLVGGKVGDRTAARQEEVVPGDADEVGDLGPPHICAPA